MKKAFAALCAVLSLLLAGLPMAASAAPAEPAEIVIHLDETAPAVQPRLKYLVAIFTNLSITDGGGQLHGQLQYRRQPPGADYHDLAAVQNQFIQQQRLERGGNLGEVLVYVGDLYLFQGHRCIQRVVLPGADRGESARRFRSHAGKGDAV